MLREQHTPGNTQSPPADVQLSHSPKGLMAKYKERLKIVGDFLDPDGDMRDQRKRQDSLSVVMKELGRKQQEIERLLGQEQDDKAINRLQKKLAIVQAQQQKGRRALERHS